jgi:hypothetical protein
MGIPYIPPVYWTISKINLVNKHVENIGLGNKVSSVITPTKQSGLENRWQNTTVLQTVLFIASICGNEDRVKRNQIFHIL